MGYPQGHVGFRQVVAHKSVGIMLYYQVVVLWSYIGLRVVVMVGGDLEDAVAVLVCALRRWPYVYSRCLACRFRYGPRRSAPGMLMYVPCVRRKKTPAPFGTGAGRW